MILFPWSLAVSRLVRSTIMPRLWKRGEDGFTQKIPRSAKISTMIIRRLPIYPFSGRTIFLQLPFYIRTPWSFNTYPKRKPRAMKHVDYLYFNIYNYFYRLSLDRNSINPRMQAMYLFSLGSGGWLLLLESLYLHLLKHSRFVSPAQSTVFAGSIYMLTAFFFYYIFIARERDIKIYDRYEEVFLRNPRRKLHFILSVGTLVLPYLVMASFAILFPRHS